MCSNVCLCLYTDIFIYFVYSIYLILFVLIRDLVPVHINL